jgi:hypothetical protein
VQAREDESGGKRPQAERPELQGHDTACSISQKGGGSPPHSIGTVLNRRRERRWRNTL